MPEPNPTDNATRKTPQQPAPPETFKDQRTGPWVAANLGVASQPPSRIGRFEVRKLLGEGAFARVYLGFDPELEREVAIKVPKVDELTPEFREAFLRENRLAAIIHHPNICPIYDVGSDGSLPYIVMRMVPSTLAGMLRRLAAPLPPRFAVAITRKLALGLTAAHAQKVIHRDLKPANVLYDEANREVLIADFGLARFADQASEASNGVPKGTPAYMAPEQARGQAAVVGPLSDVYALGVILYEMLAGRVPFTGSVWEVMRDHCETPPVPPSTLRPGLDSQADALVLKALAKHPADRHASAKAFATALADYLRASENAEAMHVALAEEIPEQPGEQKSRPAAPIFRIVPLPGASIAAPPQPIPPQPPPPRSASPRPTSPPPAKTAPLRAEPPSPRAEPKTDSPPKDRVFRLAIWASVGLLALFLAASAVVLVVVSRSGKRGEQVVTTDREKEAFDAELQRDWDDYQRASAGTTSRPFFQVRGPNRWQSWKQAAEANNTFGMVLYANCLEIGIGVEKDPTEAVKWYRKAADLGVPIAMSELALCYRDGKGVAVDTAEALVWLRKAVDLQDRMAMYTLGKCYETGTGVTKDEKEAVAWYRKSAELGGTGAMVRLGFCHYVGKGVARDAKEAMAWYRKAADLGDSDGMRWLGTHSANGWGVPQDYAKAKEYYEQAAVQGNAQAQNSLALLYFNGKGVPQDYTKAKEWYEKAAAQGNAQAQNSLGVLYYDGKSVPQDYVKAREWYEKAAAQGNASAQDNLGIIYRYGKGVTLDYAKAKELFEKAAAQGNASAQKNLGLLYYYGYGVTRDYAKAKEWYEKAAAQNNENAQYYLGRMYEYGYGVTKNANRAIEWYRKAADQGHEPAKKAIERLEKK